MISESSSISAAPVRLTTVGLGHRFGARVLFRMLDLDVHGGRPLVVTGSNGSGKSTLMRILAGVLRPSRGDVALYDGDRTVPVEERPLRCGMVAPYLNVYEHFSPLENLEFICRVRGLDDARERSRSVLERVGLSGTLVGREGDPVRTFSSGMLQRVRLACALVADPVALLLDEPTATLDEAGVRVVHGIAEDEAADGKIVVIATNEPAEADRYADRVHIGDYALRPE